MDSCGPLLYLNDSSPVGGMLARCDIGPANKPARVFGYDVIGNVVGYLDPDNGSGDGTSFVQSRLRRVNLCAGLKKRIYIIPPFTCSSNLKYEIPVRHRLVRRGGFTCRRHGLPAVGGAWHGVAWWIKS